MKKQMKTTWYAQPHTSQKSWSHGMETAALNQATIFPIVHHDEGLGNPSALATHPENAAFVVQDNTNCFPDSRVDNVFCQFTFALTKGALETDKVTGIKCAFMPIHTAFKEDLIAIDELTSIETQDVLELTSESTDRQAHPLYNDVKMVERYSNSALMATSMPGLTTTQVLEGVTFGHTGYYNSLHYLTIAGKMKTLQSGLKWFTLTRQHPIKVINIKFNSKSKYMNPYTFFGVLCYVPAIDSTVQIPNAAEVTNIPHVSVNVVTRYNEWNQNFDFRKVSS